MRDQIFLIIYSTSLCAQDILRSFKKGANIMKRIGIADEFCICSVNIKLKLRLDKSIFSVCLSHLVRVSITNFKNELVSLWVVNLFYFH